MSDWLLGSSTSNSDASLAIANSAYILAASATSDLATLSSTVGSHTSSIGTHTSNIASNTSNIASNTSNIGSHTSSISSHTSSIATNASNIATNTSNISAVTTTANNALATANSIAVITSIPAPRFEWFPTNLSGTNIPNSGTYGTANLACTTTAKTSTTSFYTNSGAGSDYHWALDGTDAKVLHCDRSISQLGLSGSTDFSISYWMNQTTFPTPPIYGGCRMAITRWTDGVNDQINDTQYQVDGTNYYNQYINSSSVTGLTTAIWDTLGVWKNYTMTYNATTYERKLYINGVYTNTNTLVFNIPDDVPSGPSNPYGLHIGGCYNGSGRDFMGKFGSLRIWNSALTAIQVYAMYSEKYLATRNQGLAYNAPSNANPVSIPDLRGILTGNVVGNLTTTSLTSTGLCNIKCLTYDRMYHQLTSGQNQILLYTTNFIHISARTSGTGLIRDIQPASTYSPYNAGVPTNGTEITIYNSDPTNSVFFDEGGNITLPGTPSILTLSAGAQRCVKLIYIDGWQMVCTTGTLS